MSTKKSILPAVVAMWACIVPSLSFGADTSQSHVATIIENEHTAGAQVVLVRRGRILYQKAFGVRNLTTGQPVDERTRFEIGSITKQFTAAAILQLKERGKLSLSDRLGKYVPQYARGRDVTLEQMLWQVSGIPDYTEAKAYARLIVVRHGRVVPSNDIGLTGVLALIRNRPLDFKPGSGMEYSNTNYSLLGQVVAVVSGMSWEQYVRKHLFEPAAMASSSFMDDESHIRDMATGYTLAPGGRRPIPTGPDIGGGGGDGAIVATAEDLAKWEEALFGGKIISQADLNLMTAPGLRPLGPHAYGFGWAIDRYDGLSQLSHDGATLGFASNLQVYPDLSQYVIVLTNAYYAHPGVIADVVFNEFNPSLAAKANVAVPNAPRRITAVVEDLIRGFSSGHFNHAHFTDRMYKFIENHPTEQWDYLGKAKSLIYRGRTSGQSDPVYKYRLLYDTGAVLTISVAVTPDDKIEGLEFWIY